MSRGGRLTSLIQVLMPIVIGLSLVAGAARLLFVLDQQRTTLMRAEQLMYLPKGEYLRLATLGYRQLAADIIWLQAVQHIGARRDTQEGYSWTFHAVDVLTDLDPTFVAPYQATGVLLGVLVGHHDEGIAILTKGMRHNPNVWQLPFLAGYISYYELCDPGSGGKYLRMAAQTPGAPTYLPKLAARMTVESGDPDAALEFLDRFSRSVNDERIREALTQRKMEIIQERDLLQLEDSVRRYYTRYERFPSKLDDLVLRGMIHHIPSDPLGGQYEVNFMTGAVSASSRRERLRIHGKVACRIGTQSSLSQGEAESVNAELPAM
jgi:hypothetical protein